MGLKFKYYGLVYILMGVLQTGSVFSSNAGLINDLVQIVQNAPTAPTNVTSTAAFVMEGLAIAFTPKSTGRILVIGSFQLGNSTTADGANVLLAYGTGTAPANAAAAAGTTFGNTAAWTALTGVLNVGSSVVGLATGLTVGTAYWIDLQAKAITGGAVVLSALNFVIIEF